MICESCYNAVAEDGLFGLDDEEIAQACIEFGADLPDHLCDDREAGNDNCECSGHESN